MDAGGALPTAGSQGGAYKEGSSPRAPFSPAEDIILQQLPWSKQSAPQTWRTGQCCARVFFHSWAMQGLAGAAGLEAAAGRCPGGVSPVHLPCSAGALGSLPDTTGPCTQHELQPSLSLPTNLFQFIKLTNRG